MVTTVFSLVMQHWGHRLNGSFNHLIILLLGPKTISNVNNAFHVLIVQFLIYVKIVIAKGNKKKHQYNR